MSGVQATLSFEDNWTNDIHIVEFHFIYLLSQLMLVNALWHQLNEVAIRILRLATS